MSRWKVSLPLQSKVVAFFVLLLMLIVVEWLYSSAHERNALREQMAGRGDVLVRTLAQLSEEPLVGLQIRRLEQQVDSILQEKDVRFARVYSANYQVLAATDRNWEGWYLSGKIVTKPELEFSGETMTARSPILIAHQIRGMAEVAFALASMDAKIAKGQKVFVLIFVGEALLSILFALLLEVQFARPLERLSAQVDRITPDSPGLPLGAPRLAAREIVRVGSSIDDMRRKLKQAQEAVVAKAQLATMGQLAANMTHEIRNPLEAISGAVEILSSEDALSEDSHVSLAIIQEEIQNLNDYLGEFLEFAHPEPVALSPSSLNELVADCIVLMKPVFRKKRIEIRQLLQHDLPAVTADATRIKRVIVNVLLNSAEAVSDGGVIHVSTSAGTDSRVCVEIFDDGVGISSDVLPRVFDPYFTTKKTGSGIGLALSRKIMEEHGGSIRINSLSERGTTVLLELPCDPKESRCE